MTGRPTPCSRAQFLLYATQLWELGVWVWPYGYGNGYICIAYNSVQFQPRQPLPVPASPRHLTKGVEDGPRELALALHTSRGDQHKPGHVLWCCADQVAGGHPVSGLGTVVALPPAASSAHSLPVNSRALQACSVANSRHARHHCGVFFYIVIRYRCASAAVNLASKPRANNRQ